MDRGKCNHHSAGGVRKLISVMALKKNSVRGLLDFFNPHHDDASVRDWGGKRSIKSTNICECKGSDSLSDHN